MTMILWIRFACPGDVYGAVANSIAEPASLMILVVLCFPRGGLLCLLLVLIVVGSILLACYAVNDLGLHPAVGKSILR